jgi:activator-of-BECN1-regulated-autophagy protein 1
VATLSHRSPLIFTAGAFSQPYVEVQNSGERGISHALPLTQRPSVLAKEEESCCKRVLSFSLGVKENKDPFYYRLCNMPFGKNPFAAAINAAGTDNDESSHPVLPIPNEETMQARWSFRDAIRKETSEHRRIMKHSRTGRNIVSILHDREQFGASHLSQPRRRRLRPSNTGNRSPSTVFESPISTTSAARLDAQIPENNGPEQEDEKELSLVQKIEQSRCPYPLQIAQECRFFAESFSASRYQSSFLHHLGGNDEPLDAHGQRPTSSPAVSTISIAFSPDSQTVASTHGDHTVKISCCNTGRLLKSLEGHPRTPWTVKYHPTNSAIVASGCLGHQVRVWNWKQQQLLQMVRLEYAIISLSFHPTGSLLAVANGTRLHFWGVLPESSPRGETPSLLELDQRHMLRCVHFPPNGKTLILGGVNPSSEDARRRNRGGIGGGGMSFYLRLWDFDMERLKEGANMGRRILSNVSWFHDACIIICHSTTTCATHSFCSCNSHEPLYRAPFFTMMEVLMYHLMVKRYAHVQSTGYQRESIMPWS